MDSVPLIKATNVAHLHLPALLVTKVYNPPCDKLTLSNERKQCSFLQKIILKKKICLGSLANARWVTPDFLIKFVLV